VSWYQKGKTNLDFTEARKSEWQWHQLGPTPAPHHSVFTCPSCRPTNSVKALKAHGRTPKHHTQYSSTGVGLHNNYRFCYICTANAKYAEHRLRCPLKEDNKQNWLTGLLFIRTSVTQRVLSGHVVSRQDTNRNNTKCMLSVRHHYNTTPVTPCSAEHFFKCVLTFSLCSYSRSHKPQTVSILNVLNDAVSIHLLCRNALDIHCNIRLHSFMSMNVLVVGNW